MNSKLGRMVVALAGMSLVFGCAEKTFIAARMDNDPLAEWPAVTLAARSKPAAVVAPAPYVPPPADEAAGAAQEVSAKRSVIYSAVLQVVVSNLQAALEQVNAMATSTGGYLQEQNGETITIRVPATKFDETIARISKLGEVVGKQIKASDITEEMLDIQIRLDNAMKTRDRLLKLLETSSKTEDTLKIETELARLTNTIEQIKGHQRFLEQQVAMSSIKVVFNSPVQQQTATARLPFPWVNELGDGLVTGRAEDRPQSESWLNRGVRFELPKSYVRYYVQENRTEAMSAAEVNVKVQKHDNYDKGGISFWGELARKAMVEHRAIAIAETRELTLNAGAPAMLFAGTREVGRETQGYLLLLAANEDSVITFEAWGPAAEMKREAQSLENAAKSIRLKR